MSKTLSQMNAVETEAWCNTIHAMLRSRYYNADIEHWIYLIEAIQTKGLPGVVEELCEAAGQLPENVWGGLGQIVQLYSARELQRLRELKELSE